MKIVIACGIFPPDIGGPATYAKKIADHCAARGFEVSVLTFSDGVSHDRSPAESPYVITRIDRARVIFVRYYLYGTSLWKLSKHADLIYAQGPLVGGLHAFILKIFRKKKYVVKMTGDYAWEQMASRYGSTMSLDEFQMVRFVPIRIMMLRFIQKIVVRFADAVIVPSKYLEKIVHGWAPLSRNISVIYNSADQNSRDAIDTRIEFLLSGDPYALSIGRLVPWKGFGALIDIWPQVLKQNPGLHLVIVGSGLLYGMLEQKIHDLSLAAYVHLVGQKTAGQISYVLSKARLFVLNSSYEGLSHTLLEAMMHGVPCIATNVGGNNELITDMNTGILVPYNHLEQLAEAITSLNADQQRARELGMNGREFVRKVFSTDVMLSQTIDVLKRCIP